MKKIQGKIFRLIILMVQFWNLSQVFQIPLHFLIGCILIHQISSTCVAIAVHDRK